MITSDVLVAPQPEKSTQKLIWIGVAVVGVLALCSAICVAAVVFVVGRVAVEKPPVEATLDSFMKFMAAEDVNHAHELFSPRVPKQVLDRQLEEMIEGNNFALYEGYQSLTVQDINISVAVNPDPNLPQGTVATFEGMIFYDDGFQGTFDGTMEKVDGKWHIYSINVTVPPDKIRP